MKLRLPPSLIGISSATVLGALALGCDAPVPEAQPTKDTASSSALSGKPGASAKRPGPPPAATPAEKKPAKGPFPESKDPLLKEPEKLTEKAPDSFQVKFETTAGDFLVDCTREWAPNGVDRFYNLVKVGFYDDVGFFRAVQQPRPFVVQFGIHGNPDVSRAWVDARIAPDDVKRSNVRGMLTFAMAGSPDTRTTQVFINYGDNANLDKMGFAPLCSVSGDGMSVVEKIYSGYGERPSGAQGQIQKQGNAFLRETFPELDYVKTARLVTPGGEKADPKAAGSSAPAAGSSKPVAEPRK